MRVRLLRVEDDSTVLLVYPATREEYGRALETLGAAGRGAGAGSPYAGRGEGRAVRVGYVVTTAAQRDRWGLPDVAASGRACVVDERQALDMLRKGTIRPTADHEALAESTGAAARPARDAAGARSGLDAVRELVAPGAHVDQVLEALDGAELPEPVCKTLRRALRQALASEAQAVEEAVERAETVLSLPWRTRAPERFDATHLKRALDRTHGGLEGVKTRLIEVLAASPQTRGPLTVEGPRRGAEAETQAAALVVRPGRPRAEAPVPCLAGARGTGKTSLAVAVAQALGLPHVRIWLGKGNPESLIRGVENGVTGRIVDGLCEAGVDNPVFVLEGLDRVESEAAEALLDVLDPARRPAFRDEYLRVPFDLSPVVWIATAADPGAIPEAVRKRIEVIEMPAYTAEEKLAIAQRYLLRRPFVASAPTAATCLLPDPAAATESDTAGNGPAVLLDREVASVQELAALSASPPHDTVETWWTAACTGGIRFEAGAVRRVVEDHTSEPGVADLQAKLAAVCRQMVRRRLPGSVGPQVVTPAVVGELLGPGATLPPAVRAAIARERRRLGAASDGDDTSTNDWIECLEQLPWTRRAEAPIDLAQVRAALDAGHAGLERVKTCILEHLAVRRRNPRSPAVLCLAGAPGVGKTSLARCVADTLGCGFVKLACGGLRDETDLRGHNRTWKDAQPGWILRELRRIGSKDPVVLLDEIDKLGPGPAAVLLEVLDPAQHHGFRDAFVEVPFDLSEVLFITTANQPAQIPPALRDRLEVVDLPGYSEAEKLAIAESHLIAAQNQAAGLAATPVRFTRGACRRIIREYTSERGVRQFARCLQAVCRKVTLGLETGDASLVRDRVTVRQVRAVLGAPEVDRRDGLDRIGEQLDAPALPPAVRARGRQVLERLSAWASTDPDHARAREYLHCLLSLPWTARMAAPLNLARARAILDAGHSAHEVAKESGCSTTSPCAWRSLMRRRRCSVWQALRAPARRRWRGWSPPRSGASARGWTAGR